MSRPRLEFDPRLPTGADFSRLIARLVELFRSISNAVNRCADGYVSGTVSVTAAYTVQRGDVVILANAAGGAYAVTMQSPGEAADKVLHVRKTEAGANNVTVTPPSGTIDGAATLALTAAAPRATIASDGTNFYTL